MRRRFALTELYQVLLCVESTVHTRLPLPAAIAPFPREPLAPGARLH